MFESGGLNAKGHLLGKLQAGGGKLSLSHFQGAYEFMSFFSFGSVIHVKAWVTVTNHTSGLKFEVPG